MTRNELKKRLDKLSDTKIEFVAQVVHSLEHPPETQIHAPATWITESSRWMEYFGLALSVHHSATTEPLGHTAFEHVFRNACRNARWTLDPPGSATQRFVDLTVSNGRRWTRKLSLKSTAAKSIRERSAHISKLTEAAWIQDVRRPRDRRQRFIELFREYRAAVDAIVMLRTFRTDNVPNRYQLIEIPATIFESIDNEPLTSFESEAPKITCATNGRSTAVVAVDRSDAKLTVRSIQLSACTVHAEWHRQEETQR